MAGDEIILSYSRLYANHEYLPLNRHRRCVTFRAGEGTLRLNVSDGRTVCALEAEVVAVHASIAAELQRNVLSVDFASVAITDSCHHRRD